MQSVPDEDDLNVCGGSTIQNIIICDVVVPCDLEDGPEMPLLDSSEELNVMTVKGPGLIPIHQ
jgi:hypothetical protein